MQYTILEINEKDSWVKFETTLKDGTKYTKRMMVDIGGREVEEDGKTRWMSGKEAIQVDILAWYEQYHKDLATQLDASELKGLVGKPQTVGK